MIRGAVRFGQIVLAAVRHPRGLWPGLAHEPVSRQRAMPALAILLVVAANVEALRAPFGYTRYEGISKLYDVLRTTGDDTWSCLDALLSDVAVSLQHDVHARLDPVLEADRERLFGVQAAKPVCERRGAARLSRRTIDGEAEGARRHARRRRCAPHAGGGCPTASRNTRSFRCCSATARCDFIPSRSRRHGHLATIAGVLAAGAALWLSMATLGFTGAAGVRLAILPLSCR